MLLKPFLSHFYWLSSGGGTLKGELVVVLTDVSLKTKK